MEGERAAAASCPFFNRAQSVKRDYSTMANSNRSPSPDTLFVPEDGHYSNDEHPAQRLSPPRRTTGLALPGRASRFAGDGLDYRRPIMSAGGSGSNTGSSSNAAMVIDLTEEGDTHGTQLHAAPEPAMAHAAGSSRAQRLPRYGRNIIDMTSDAEEEQQPEATSSRPNFADFLPPPGHRNLRDHHPRISLLRRPQRPHSDTSQHNSDNSDMDDLEFLETRPRTRTQAAARRSHTPAANAATAHRSVTPYPGGFPNTIDLTEDDDDEVVHLESRTRPGGVNLTSPGATAGVGTRSAAERVVERGFDFTGLLQQGSRLLQRYGNFGGLDGRVEHNHNHNHGAGGQGNQHRNENQPHLRFVPPPAGRGGFAVALNLDMNYDVTGFDMGFIGGNRPPTPKYEPPEPAAGGFTRTPAEDEVVVCPNCGDELAVGDSESKQSIWAIKKCGHVYCGDCAEHRAKSSSKASKKGKGKAMAADGPPPFKHCVVDGCKEPASSKSMIRVYFGS